MQEVWKDVVGYEGLYQVSNLGRVKSLNYHRTGKEKVLKLHKGYKKQKNKSYVTMRIAFYKNKKRKEETVSRLVYSAFRGEIPQGMQIDHINNNSEDNRLDNLQLLTPSENDKKKFIDSPELWCRCGIKARSIRCLNNGKIYRSISDASKVLNVDRNNLRCVLNGKRKSVCGYSFEYV